VQPGARRGTTLSRRGGAFVLSVRAKAVEGQANSAVIAELAQLLGVRKGAVEIRGGLRSRRKHIRVSGNADLLRSQLDSAASQ
jgi:uncharacterized protein YggU (UPF0235/DUF167 family)